MALDANQSNTVAQLTDAINALTTCQAALVAEAGFVTTNGQAYTAALLQAAANDCAKQLAIMQQEYACYLEIQNS